MSEKTMPGAALAPEAGSQRPARRCPDFDADCADVPDHVRCAAGGLVFHSRLGILESPPIDGFCPYLCGILRPARLTHPRP